MFVRWNLTVCSATHNSLPIASFDRPRATEPRIVVSRSVRSCGTGAALSAAKERWFAPPTFRHDRLQLGRQALVAIGAAASANCARLAQCSGMTPEQVHAPRDSVDLLHVVINHLRLREPVTDATLEAARTGTQLMVDAGALAARVAKVDETRLILILEFSTAEDADRIAREVGGPWMRENLAPLLADGAERSVAEVIASADA